MIELDEQRNRRLQSAIRCNSSYELTGYEAFDRQCWAHLFYAFGEFE